MKRRSLLVLALVLVLALLSTGGAWLYSKWTQSPEYSLLQAKRAYESNDEAQFLRYVDVHAAIETAVDAIFEVGLDAIKKQEDDSTSVLMAALAGDYLAVHRSRTIEYAREELLSEVGGRSYSKPMRAQLLGTGNVKFTKSYFREENGYAYIGIERTPSELAIALPFEFKLRKMDGYWQVIELSNLKTLVNAVSTSRTANSVGARDPLRPLSTNLGSTADWFYSEWNKSPEYSLLQLKKAIDTHDSVLFERHCDIDTLITRAVDVTMEIAVAELGNSIDQDDAFAVALALALVQVMKPTLIEYARGQLLLHVEGRAPPPVAKKAKKTGPEMALDTLFSNSNNTVKNASIQREGSVAFFSLVTYDKQSKTETSYQFKLRDIGGHWQVVELSNLKALMSPNKS